MLEGEYGPCAFNYVVEDEDQDFDDEDEKVFFNFRSKAIL